MLKLCSPFIDQYILHIINCCIEVGSAWKVSIGKPLAKSPNPSKFNDLRIISILPALSKVFERVLFNQMYTYFINKVIPENQCGFKKKCSTEFVLTNVIDDIVRSTVKKC